MKRLLAWLRRLLARGACDPAELLKQSVRDLEDQVPALNENLSLIKAQVTLHEKELERLRDKRSELESKAREALASDRADIAANYDTTRADVDERLARHERDLRLTRATFELAQEHKRAFMAGKEELIRAASDALAATRQAEWNRQVARTLQGFERSAKVGRAEQLEAVRRFKAEALASEAELRAVLERLIACERRLHPV